MLVSLRVVSVAVYISVGGRQRCVTGAGLVHVAPSVCEAGQCSMSLAEVACLCVAPLCLGGFPVDEVLNVSLGHRGVCCIVDVLCWTCCRQ